MATSAISFVASIMNTKSDIYIQQNAQDENTGFVNRQWVYNETIQCKIEPVSSPNSYSRGGNKAFDTGQAGYQEKIQLRVKTLKPLSRRWRIGNIRSNNNQKLYFEIDKIDEPDTFFEVFSSHAVLDPFGKLSYYESIVQRVPVQNNDTIQN